MRKIEQIYTQCYENILNEQHSYIRLRKTLGYRYFSALDEAKDLSLTNQRLLFRKVKGKSCVNLEQFLDCVRIFRNVYAAFSLRRTQKAISDTVVSNNIHSKINSSTTAIERAIQSKKHRVKQFFKSRFSTIVNLDIEIIFTDDPSRFGCMTVQKNNAIKQVIKLDKCWWNKVYSSGLSYCNGTYTLAANLIALTPSSTYYEAAWLSSIDNNQYVVSNGLLIKTMVSGETAFYHADNLAEGVQLVIDLIDTQDEVKKLPLNAQ